MPVRQRGTSFQSDFSFNGKRYRKDFDKESDADLWENETRGRLLKGEVFDPLLSSKSVTTLDQLLQSTFDRHWNGTKAADTSYGNANSCVQFFGGTKPPSYVSEARIDEMVTKFRVQKLSGGTINRRLSALSKMLKHAYSRGWVSRIPRIERLKESEHRIRWITAQEEANLLAHMSSRQTDVADLLVILIDSGCRLSEGLGLRWIDVADGWLRFWGDESKNGKSRSVPQSDRVKSVLAKRRQMGERVFPNLTIWMVEHFWKGVRSQMNLDHDTQFVPHCLRHTFCSRLVQRGVALLVVQQLAGHKTITMTMRYAHLAPANLVDAIKALGPGVDLSLVTKPVEVVTVSGKVAVETKVCDKPVSKTA